MKKEQLKELGLTDEQATAVSNAYADYVPKSRLDEVIEERNGLRDQIAERDKQIAELGKNAGDNQALKDQIAQLQTANEQAAKDYESNLAKVKLDNAVELALTGARAKNNKAVRGLLDLTKSKVGEDGKVEGLDEQIKALQKSDAYLFESSEPNKQPAQFKGTVPQEGNPAPKQKAVKDMTYGEMLDHVANGGSLD